jgi:predicted ATPase
LHQQIGGAFEDAQATADEIIELGKEISDSTYLLQAHHSAWTTAGHVGDHMKTLSHTQAGLELYSMGEHSASMNIYGDHDAGVCGHVHNSHTHWCLGNLEQAVKARDDSLKLARNLDHPPTSLLAETSAAMLSQFLAERERVREGAERVIALSLKHEVSSWHSNGEILLGWVEAEEGDPSGFARMAKGVASRESAGSRLRQTYFLAIYAEQLILAGRFDEARDVLVSAVQCLELAREHRWEPLLHIVQGDLAKALSDTPAATQCYKAAIGVAKHQQALSFELVAECRLTSLCTDNPSASDALESLQDTYGKFSEGLHFPPIRAAKTLLDNVNH